MTSENFPVAEWQDNLDNDKARLFWSKVDKSGGPEACWEWQAGRQGEYGDFWTGTRDVGAHRVAYFLTYGPFPNDALVTHNCDNPSCVNPNHLRLGTHSSNRREAYTRGLLGKLAPEDVQRIRRLYATGRFTQTELGEIFGVNQQSISNVILRETWDHIK